MTPVDLSQLQQVVGQYTEQHRALLAAGPISAAAVTRMFFKNKAVNKVMFAGGTLFAIEALGGPALKLMQDQFGNLQQLFVSFR